MKSGRIGDSPCSSCWEPLRDSAATGGDLTALRLGTPCHPLRPSRHQASSHPRIPPAHRAPIGGRIATDVRAFLTGDSDECCCDLNIASIVHIDNWISATYINLRASDSSGERLFSDCKYAPAPGALLLTQWPAVIAHNSYLVLIHGMFEVQLALDNAPVSAVSNTIPTRLDDPSAHDYSMAIDTSRVTASWALIRIRRSKEFSAGWLS